MSLHKSFSLIGQFQFHKGTIKTSLTRFINKNSIIFQFHKGTIKTLFASPEEVNIPHFNSIKVRLKLVLSERLRPFSIISIP